MNGLDFRRLGSSSAANSATEPRRIFAALPSKEAKYSYPRDVQSEVWDAWHERRHIRDLTIKMNTGSGKTVVGLLMLKSSLNEGLGPAAYISPDKQLTEQVIEEAGRLGLELVDQPDSPRFLQGKAILATNIYKLFNGRSVFGVKGGSRPPSELATVLIDDAHACLATIESQYTLSVPNDHPAYEGLFDLFLDDLRTQSQAGLMALESGDPGIVLPIPYWAWIDNSAKVLELLYPHRGDQELLFNWPLLTNDLHICRAAISTDSIQVSPPCPPIETIPSFDRARRRIYLTATLSDDSVLVTHFGADPQGIRDPITPRSAADIGDRMILTPEQTFPAQDPELIREFVAEQAKSGNVVVIVPSWARAELWRDSADAVHGANSLQEGLSDLRSSHVGLVVLVNKYDGIDLPGDACHFLVLDGLPEAIGTLDRLDMQAMEGSDALLSRQVQRLEQGMGRGIRSNEDYCVVLLLGRRLAARLYPPNAREKFSPATRAQLALSDKVSELLQGSEFAELQGVVDQCLTRDQGWITASRSALDDVVYPAQTVVAPIAVQRRQAFDKATAGRCRESAEELQKAIDRVDDRRLRGLLKQESAAYLHHVDPVGAQKLQVSAYADNRGLIRPKKGVAYVRLKDGAPQAQAASEFLRKNYESSTQFILRIESLLEELTPDTDPASVPGFERAFCDLAQHLGFVGQQPERDIGNGPDVLWAIGEACYLVVECKSGSEQDLIFRSDVSQLSHSIDWFKESYDQTAQATPILVHPSRLLDKKASSRQGTRVITFDKLKELRESVRKFATSVASPELSLEPGELWPQLTSQHFNGPAFVNHWTVPPRKAS